MPENSKVYSSEKCLENFARVNQIFNAIGFNEGIKTTIFRLLASILHLSDIQFGDGSDGTTQILKPFEKNIEIASKLMEISADGLKAALLFKTIKENKSEIM